ncbi:glycosyltransferase [Cohnella sp. GCM10027633]|uniref:glycosyltransferase n=1 Tax=unclassified Cohnella TaxID=2636738 RepID=UPI003634E822
MGIVILIVVVCGCLCGFLLFRNKTLPPASPSPGSEARTLTVIVPARNEEVNLPHLLESLAAQTLRPTEVIVVDDCSEDRTRQIAERYGATVIAGSPPPPDWTGKNWAVWNGYAASTGDVLVFLDADVRLEPGALASLVRARDACHGVVSVVPYHRPVRFYEKLSMITNVLGAFAFTSPFERTNARKGLYGACIVASRADYDNVNGHASVKSEVLDDLFLGSRFMEAGVPVSNYLGGGLVSFRMYPHGIRSEVEGFSKGAALSTSTLSPWTVLPTAVWTVGLLASEFALFALAYAWSWPLFAAYALCTLQLAYFARSVGRFGLAIPLLHALSSLFFVAVMLVSLFQVLVLRRVVWKGRHIEVGGGNRER